MTYKLSEAAAKDIEDILEQSLLEFGPLQTERYYKALKRCLELLSDWALPLTIFALDIAALPIRAM